MLTILQPLAAPIAVAAVGALASHFVFARRRQADRRIKPGGLLPLLAVAAFTALLPNSAQTLYELGLSFPTIEWVQLASYFVFAFAALGV